MSKETYPEISIVDTDTDKLVKEMISSYEGLTGKTLYPASPERLLILWAASIIVQQRVLINTAAQQNVPRYAKGKYLDSIAELFNGASRLPAKAATTTIRFTISQTLTSAHLVPLGTRVTTVDGNITFRTTKAVYVAVGSTYTDVPAVCETVGDVGNGLTAGQISEIVDLFPYYQSCSNTTTSANGSDVEDDDAFYRRMRESEDTYSTAGSIGSYIYHAKTANSAIIDVAVSSPSAGNVSVYLLMENGALPSAETLAAVTTVLSADEVRPVTDNVTVIAPGTVTYNINVTYYIPSDSDASASDIEAAVAAAVAKYKSWQSAKLGRDVNPSKLISLLMETGVKRVAVTSPTYAAVGSNEVASKGTESVINGGYENE
ncbi:MAG: baseplate J/gp47 family protein [Oscillospiraceae bacterium]